MRPWFLIALLAACPGKEPGEDDDADGDGVSVSDGDCDDGDASVNPNASETCGSVDHDCDGVIGDDDPAVGELWFADTDRDGFGDDTTTVLACAAPGADWVQEGGDCQPLDGEAFPEAAERCNELDDDCDGVVDNDIPVQYADLDEDGYGDPDAPLTGCDASDGRVGNADDCDDTDPDINPETVWYFDQDGDGYGVPNVTDVSCESPGADYAMASGDCRPMDAAGYPGAPEICNNGQQAQNIDDDCDGFVDEGCGVVYDCLPITEDVTWSGDRLVPCDVVVGGVSEPTLTIADGAVLRFGAGASLRVGGLARGGLLVQGGAQGVLFASGVATPAAGDWGGVVIETNSGDVDVSGLTVEYAGFGSQDAAVYVYGNEPNFSDLVIRQVDGDGLTVRGGLVTVSGGAIEAVSGSGVNCHAGGDGAFTDLSITTSGLGASADVDCVDAFGAGVTLAGNAANEVLVTGLRLSETASWTDIGAPYHITQGFSVADPDALVRWTLLPGVEVRVDAGEGIRIGAAGMGELRALGSEAAPITFASAEAVPAAGDWDGLAFQGSEGSNQLDYVHLLHTGASEVLDAGLYINGADAVVVGDHLLVQDGAADGITVWDGMLTLRDSVVQNHDGYGLVVDAFGDLVAPIEGSVFTGNAAPAQFGNADAVAFLSPLSTYIGNALDAIVVSDLTLERTSVWVDLGVPYLMENSLTAAADGGMAWTIDDAVLQFGAGAGLQVGMTTSRTGSLLGTNVTFEAQGGAQTLGAWSGISARGQLGLTDSVVRYAGGTTGAAVEVYSGSASINSTAVEGYQDLAVRCWSGTSITSFVGNSFVGPSPATSGCVP